MAFEAYSYKLFGRQFPAKLSDFFTSLHSVSLSVQWTEEVLLRSKHNVGSIDIIQFNKNKSRSSIFNSLFNLSFRSLQLLKTAPSVLTERFGWFLHLATLFRSDETFTRLTCEKNKINCADSFEKPDIHSVTTPPTSTVLPLSPCFLKKRN